LTHSLGVASNRDSWVYNYSKSELQTNVRHTIKHFNTERDRIHKGIQDSPRLNTKDGNWTRDWYNQLNKNKEITENSVEYRYALYRPFTTLFSYFDDDLNQERYQLPKLFLDNLSSNLIIAVHGIGGNKLFSTLITDKILCLDTLEKTQCFPLYYYEENSSNQEGMFGENDGTQYTRKDAISDFIHENALQQYGLSKTGSGTITKEDIFYYVYGFLHSPEYRETFANDLKKMLPRIPLVDSINDFWAFSKAGRALADLHINYESIAPYPDCIVTGAESSFFTVEKMRFPKKGQKDTINYNSKITISKIPEKAYEYVVNGKSAIEWIMERYQITTHKDSGITNNPNDWSEEVGNPHYILDLLLSIINVSVQTVDIVSGLPKVKFGE
jgi:predicted helicase